MWFILGMMFLIMFGLKLAGIATISWVVVTAPLWAPALILTVVFLAMFLIMMFKSR